MKIPGKRKLKSFFLLVEKFERQMKIDEKGKIFCTNKDQVSTETGNVAVLKSLIYKILCFLKFF